MFLKYLVYLRIWYNPTFPNMYYSISAKVEKNELAFST